MTRQLRTKAEFSGLSGLFRLSGFLRWNQTNPTNETNRSRLPLHAARFTFFVLPLALTACSVIPASKVEHTPVVVPALPPPKTVGSLWQEENGRAYLYEDLRAMRAGDIITIKIVENQKGSKTGETTAERSSTAEDKITGGTAGLPFFSFGGSLAARLGLKASAANKFGGKGATTRADTLTGTVSAVVTDVLPNGNLRIEGHREVTVNSERQTMFLTGTVRRVDVDTKNMVLSTSIADAKIEYVGSGVVDDVQRPGWLVRILDWIYPF